MVKVNGTRDEVWAGTATKTKGGLTKHDLQKNKRGKIVSKAQSESAKKRIVVMIQNQTGIFKLCKKCDRKKKVKKANVKKVDVKEDELLLKTNANAYKGKLPYGYSVGKLDRMFNAKNQSKDTYMDMIAFIQESVQDEDYDGWPDIKANKGYGYNWPQLYRNAIQY